MSPLSISRPTLPNVCGFLRKSPMFRRIHHRPSPTSTELVRATGEAFRRGAFQPGDYFPTPAQIAEFSGASLEESLRTVAILLERGTIVQNSKGVLVIASCPPKRKTVRQRKSRRELAHRPLTRLSTADSL